jgi:hypothetical protein
VVAGSNDLIEYIFLHDIAKPDCLTLKVEGEKNGIEIETAASLIKSSSKIKAKIQNEAEEMNYLPRSAKLPI